MKKGFNFQGAKKVGDKFKEAKLRESMNLPDRVETLVEKKVEEILAKKRDS